MVSKQSFIDAVSDLHPTQNPFRHLVQLVAMVLLFLTVKDQPNGPTLFAKNVAFLFLLYVLVCGLVNPQGNMVITHPDHPSMRFVIPHGNVAFLFTVLIPYLAFLRATMPRVVRKKRD